MDLAGVLSVEVSYTDASAKVTYDTRKVEPETIAATISELGFPANVRSESTDDS